MPGLLGNSRGGGLLGQGPLAIKSAHDAKLAQMMAAAPQGRMLQAPGGEIRGSHPVGGLSDGRLSLSEDCNQLVGESGRAVGKVFPLLVSALATSPRNTHPISSEGPMTDRTFIEWHPSMGLRLVRSAPTVGRVREDLDEPTSTFAVARDDRDDATEPPFTLK
jgi:hypothetical protein